jgi:steroid delta-isomerase-like uncharacterized protein
MTTTTMAEVAAADIGAVEEFGGRWAEAWNGHDADAVAAMCAEDLVYDEPALGKTVYGRDAIRDFVANMSRTFPDYTFSRVGFYAETTRRAVVVSWRFVGTVAGTDRRVEFHGDDRLEVGEDGLIHAYRCLYDNKFVERQVRG